MSKFVTLHGFSGSGGGAELNFEVVASTIEPMNPNENTIWVNTDSINNYYFSATQPENMVDYDVWISIGTSSAVEFNALKENGIQVYPIFAKQYVNGAWENVDAKNYTGGEWVQFSSVWNGELYDAGNEFVSVTGGWKARSIGVINTNGVKPTVKKNTDTIVITHSTYATGAALEISNDIDVSDYDILTIDMEIQFGSGYVGVIVYDRSIGQTGSSYAAPFSNTIAYKSYNGGFSGYATVDVSKINKKVCIGIASYNSITGTTNKVTMRKAILT